MSGSSELDFGDCINKRNDVYSFVVPLSENFLSAFGVLDHAELGPSAPPFANGGYVYPPWFKSDDLLNGLFLVVGIVYIDHINFASR